MKQYALVSQEFNPYYYTSPKKNRTLKGPVFLLYRKIANYIDIIAGIRYHNIKRFMEVDYFEKVQKNIYRNHKPV